jgi:hypothetical protein
MNKSRQIYLLPAILLFVLSIVLWGRISAVVSVPLPTTLSIPAQSDWIDYGPIFEHGELGEWDYQLYGGFTGAAIKKNGTYYLYYQGASGYRVSPDETVTWRAIGVATSPDGINFTKVESNPVITWFPSNNGEEGAVSGAATQDENGNIVLFYGANTAESSILVSANGRVAIASDGINFSDVGIALNHLDRSLWGAGDELFPIIVFQDRGQWFVYYIPNGTPQSRKLGIAWGNQPNALNNSSAVRSGPTEIQSWGMGGYAKLDSPLYALFLNDSTQAKTEVRTVSIDAPHQVSVPVETYQFADIQQATVMLDDETRTWFMYYRSLDSLGVKLAPAGEPDRTPPTLPSNIVAMPVRHDAVTLSWEPATDAETGIVQYKVFRDGEHLATVKGWSFQDEGLVEQNEYNYQVSAINYHGVEGLLSTPVTVTTLADSTPPRVVSVNASGNSTQITVIFDEPVERESAESLENYIASQEITIMGAMLACDERAVVLTTSEHSDGVSYLIKVDHVRDTSAAANQMTEGAELPYLYSADAGLAGAWSFDVQSGLIAYDTSNFGNNGSLVYTNTAGPVWVEGKIGNALQFDGIDDQVTVDGSGSLKGVTDQSYTLMAWANPDGLPSNTTINNEFYSVVVRQYTGLYYDNVGRFQAKIRLTDGNEVALSSEVVTPGGWHHLVMVVDDANKQLHLFVDEREVTGSPMKYGGMLASHGGSPYYIGTSEPLSQRYEYRFKGKIDEVRIYDRVTIQASVAAESEYNSYLPLTSDGTCS